VNDLFISDHYCDSEGYDYVEGCLPCPEGAFCEHGYATCTDPSHSLVGGSCVKNPQFEARVQNICSDVFIMLSERLWYENKCGNSELLSASMTSDEIMNNLLESGKLSSSDKAAFREAEGRLFCNKDSISIIGNNGYVSSEERIMVFSSCAIKLMLQDYLLGEILAIILIGVTITIIILRGRNKAMIKKATKKAEELYEILKTSNDCICESTFREKYGKDFNDKCWNLALFYLRHKSGVRSKIDRNLSPTHSPEEAFFIRS